MNYKNHNKPQTSNVSHTMQTFVQACTKWWYKMQTIETEVDTWALADNEVLPWYIIQSTMKNTDWNLQLSKEEIAKKFAEIGQISGIFMNSIHKKEIRT